eukprot:jgi/Botrbrau1/4040/Bobra.152_3s0001.1
MDHALLQHVWHIAGPLFRSLSVRIMRSIYCIHTCILSAQASTRGPQTLGHCSLPHSLKC